jgi:alkylation response protein AidB-like acyl-CoA dehydrogenase
LDLDGGDSAAEFRAGLRRWIAENAPSGLTEIADWSAAAIGVADHDALDRARALPEYAEWERRLAAASLICPHWPAEVGGRGWDAGQSATFAAECYRAGVPKVERGMGESLVGPAIIAHGSAEQQARLLPRIISAEDVYCQGFSEPDHGSDLAGLATRGVIDGDEVVLTGQKIWTSGADRATMIFVLCRTDPDASRHRGLSYVLAPMHDNNIELHEIRHIGGRVMFYGEFLDGARAPLANVIGGLGNGWRVAMTTLGHERGGRAATQHLMAEREFWELAELARERGRADDALVRDQLARAYMGVHLMRCNGMRTLVALAAGREPGPQASVAKLFWSEHHQRVGELALAIEGRAAVLRPPGAGYVTDRWQDVFLTGRANTIFSGTSEIQRNIIAQRALGLPGRSTS